MSIIKTAENHLSKGIVTSEFLDELVSSGVISKSDLKKIKEDVDFTDYFRNIHQSKDKKVSKKKLYKSSTVTEVCPVVVRNNDVFDPNRCIARVWKPLGGKGYDNIQCSSKNTILKEDAYKHLTDLNISNKYRDIDSYVEGYTGCYCKKHLSMDYYMPNKYWLGDVNKARPETLMLPTGSVKTGYIEKYKPHYWLNDDRTEVNKSTYDKDNREKYLSMKIRELKKIAIRLGASDNELDEVDDSNNVRDTLISMILRKESD